MQRVKRSLLPKVKFSPTTHVHLHVRYGHIVDQTIRNFMNLKLFSSALSVIYLHYNTYLLTAAYISDKARFFFHRNFSYNYIYFRLVENLQVNVTP